MRVLDIEYDLSALYENHIGEAGITQKDLLLHAQRWRSPLRDLVGSKQDFPLGWLDTASRAKEAEAICAFAQNYRDFGRMAVIGMGGSALGTRALACALADKVGRSTYRHNDKKLFVLDNLDSALISEVIEFSSSEALVINAVSKSGSTLEVICNLLSLMHSLKGRRVKVVVTTTDRKGALFAWAKQSGYPVLSIPEDIGGRFSAFSAVTFLPLAFLGLDPVAYAEGAHDAMKVFIEDDYEKNPALQLATATYLLHKREGISDLVLMPYTESLSDFCWWWVQLFAESLSKSKTVDGKPCEASFTPLAALAPSAQHFLLQLLLEGTNNKLTAFIKLASDRDGSGIISTVPNAFEAFDFLIKKSIEDVKEAELSATAITLKNHGRPHYLISMSKLSPESLGQLMLFYMMVVSLVGKFMNINPFDQPAVEMGKRLARDILSGI